MCYIIVGKDCSILMQLKMLYNYLLLIHDICCLASMRYVAMLETTAMFSALPWD
jgi:hypothetical protein